LPRVSRLSVATSVAAAALALAACGGGETKTVTQTVTVPVPAARTPGAPQTTPGGGTGGAAPTDPAAKKRTAFCGSTKGDALQQAGGEATKAFNERDVETMLRAQRKALAAAEDAPAGASCAVIALNTLRFNWNQGAQAFAGHDYRAEAEKVRRFQERRDLVGALPG
jgi:hypothetical protein